MSHAAAAPHDPQNLAVYLHWPFCRSKCPYCDFNSHVRARVDQDAWRDSLRREIDHYAALLPGRRVGSIYFGGGTPSLMPPETVAALIGHVKAHWPTARDAEITLEANPTSVEAENFAALREAGVNRLSLGVQSFHDSALRFLGREHSAAQAQEAIRIAARYFSRYSFDLIYARAGQTAADWEQELRAALPLTRGHMSLYQLTIEPATAFYTRAARGDALTAQPEPAADMLAMTSAIMAEAGLPGYEISNYAAPGEESRHNLTYWRYDDFIGIGPGAHGRYTDARGARFASVGKKAPEAWLAQTGKTGHGIENLTPIDAPTARREALMMGLRLTCGIDRALWREKFGDDVAAMLSAKKMQRLESEELLRCGDRFLAATPEGAMKLNAVLRYLLADGSAAINS